MGYKIKLILFNFLAVYLFFSELNSVYSQCDATTPNFTVNLSSNADSVYTLVKGTIERLDSCCYQEGDDNCISFDVTLAPGVNSFTFSVGPPEPSGAAAQYHINCDPTTFFLRDTVCLDGFIPPYKITYCKPGADKPNYWIRGVGAGEISPPIIVSNACTDTISVNGYDESNITWTSIYPGAVGDYDAFLYDASGFQTNVGEDTLIVMPNGASFPDTVAYRACGNLAGLSCGGTPIYQCDTTWVYFVTDFAVSISPANPSICFGGDPITLTANPTGGASPYSYLWKTGATTQSIVVTSGNAGDYWVQALDTMECGVVYDTVTVTQFVVSITANAGLDDTVCISSPVVTLAGVLTGATEGIWSQGLGSYNPDNISLITDYTLDASEIMAGFVDLKLNTVDHRTCSPDSDIVRIVVNPLPIMTIGSDGEVCADVMDFEISGSSHANGNVSWSTQGNGTFSDEGVDNPTYTIGSTDITNGFVYLVMTVGNNFCEPIKDSVLLTINSLPTVDAGTVKEICLGQFTATLGGTPTASGGNGSGYSYVWNNGGSLTSSIIANPIASPTVTTAYSVTVTDSKTCYATSTTTVTVNSIPTANAGAVKEICLGQSTATIGGTPTATGGNGSGYSYAWNNGGSLTSSIIANPIASPTVTTAYTVTVTDSKTCYATSTTTVTVNAIPTVSAGAVKEICLGQFTATIGGTPTASGGNGSGYSYVWNNGGSLTSSIIANPIASPTVTTAYTVTVTDSKTCYATSTTTVTVNSIPTANAGAVKEICLGQFTATIGGTPTASGGNGSGYSYVWNNGGSLTSTIIANPIASSAVTTAYSVTVTDSKTCYATSTTTVTVNSIPTASAGTVKEICLGQFTATIGGTPTATGGNGSGFSYVWNNGGSLTSTIIANPIASPTVTTAYTVTVTDSKTCYATSTTTITVNSIPTANAGAVKEICLGQFTATIGGTPTASGGNGSGYSYAWNNGGSLTSTIIANPIASPTVTTAYTVTVTDSKTCYATSTTTVTVNTIPTVSAGAVKEICLGQFTATIGGTPTASGGNGSGYSYAWNNVGSLTSSIIANPIASPTVTTAYTVTVTDSKTCYATSTTTVTVNSIPTVSAGPNMGICLNQSTTTIGGTPTASGGNGTSYSYVWNNGGSLTSSTIANPVANPTVTTVYTVTVTDSKSCYALNTVTVSVNSIPTANAGSDKEICFGSSVQIGGSPTATGNNPFTYSWSGINLNSTIIANPTSSATSSLIYTVVVTDVNGCKKSDNVNVAVTPRPTVIAGNDVEVCSSVGNVSITGSSHTNGTVVWSTSGNGSFNNNSFDNPVYTFGSNDLLGGIVNLTMTVNGNGSCSPKTDVLSITVTPAPTANAGGDKTLCADKDSYTIFGATHSNGTVDWTTSGDGIFNVSTIDNPTYNITDNDTADGFVTLIMTVTGLGSCGTAVDDMKLTLTPAPTIDAGTGNIACADNPVFNLLGTVTTATGMFWQTTGDGTLTGENTSTPNYVAGTNDILNGFVSITVTSTGNGGCTGVQDVAILTITDIPTIFAGNDTTVCPDLSPVPLLGVVTQSTGGEWSIITGNGTIATTTALATSYTPTADDVTAGMVELLIKSTGNGFCNEVQDIIKIFFAPLPSVNAGLDTTVCFDATAIVLEGIIGNVSSGIWSVPLGNGSFAPDDQSLSANYLLTTDDKQLGIFDIILTSIGGCIEISDTMKVTVSAFVNAGIDTSVCAGSTSIDLNGILSSPVNFVWTSSGDGNFVPDDLTLNTTYNFGAQDVIDETFTLFLSADGSGACPAAKDSMEISILSAPTLTTSYTDTIICKNVKALDISAAYTAADGVIWTSTGTGNFTPSDDITNTTYNLTSVDTAQDSILIIVSNVGACMQLRDTIEVRYLPAILVDAGQNQMVCINELSVAITGTVETATGGIWSSPTGGNFGNENLLSTTYEPSAADTANKFVYLYLTSTGFASCDQVVDSVKIDFQILPKSNAGIDIVECALIQSIDISGSYTNAGGVSWYTFDGLGVIDNSTLLNTSYLNDQADMVNGGPVSFVLQTTGNDKCPAYRDTMELTFVEQVEVYAGVDITECVDILGIPLLGDSSFVSSVIWGTEGTGTFDNDLLINPIYVPSEDDTIAGFVELIITGFGNATCPFDTDTLQITFNPKPYITVSTDLTLCANVNPILVNAVVNFADGVIWKSSGSGSFDGDELSLNPEYTTSEIDTATGVTLYATTTGSGSCPAEMDSVVIDFQSVPRVEAGDDQAICVTEPSTSVSGVVFGAIGGEWSTSGTGVFDNEFDLITNYVPSPADTVAGSVILTLTSVDNGIGVCEAVTDQLTLVITPNLIAAHAGKDTLLCGDSLLLNGQVEIATGGIWSAPNGDGYFNPDETTLQTYYVFGTNDTSNGNVTLILTTTGNGGCVAKDDEIIVTIQPPITINALIDDSICAYGVSMPVIANVSTGSLNWITLGDGTFTPSAQDLATNYLPGVNDLNLGYVTLIALSDNNGSCYAVADTTLISFVELPIANFSCSPVCALDTTLFNDLSTSFDGISSWLWHFTDEDSSLIQNPSYSYLIGDVVDVSLVVSSAFGCLDTVVKSVLTNPVPNIGYYSTAGCYVDSAYFTDTSSIAFGKIESWLWDLSDGAQYTGMDFAHPFSSPGSYVVTLTVYSDSGCVGVVVDTMKVNAGPLVDFEFSEPCLKEGMNFNDISTVSDGNIVQWNWVFGDGGSASGSTASHLYTSDDFFNVVLIAVTDSGCVDSVMKQVKVNSLPIPNFLSDGICLEEGTEFIDKSSGNGSILINWNWDFGDGESSDIEDPIHFYTNVGNYQITHWVETAQGCKDTITKDITINGSPIAGFTQTSDVTKPFWEVEFTDASLGAIVWSWNFGDGSESSDQNPIYAYSDTGSYEVILIIGNEFGCQDTAFGNVVVASGPVVPTGFSPNKDGHNDVLYARGGPYSKIDFKIYNNWGEMIFQSRNQSVGWDGTRNGVDQPVGVYIFTLDATSLAGIEYKNMHGDVTLLR